MGIEAGPSKDMEGKALDEKEEKSQWQEFMEDPCGYTRKLFCDNLIANIPAFIVLGLGIASLALAAIYGIASGIVGSIALLIGSQQIWALRALSVEIDTFEEENEKLESTQQRLETEVSTLGERKEKLGNQVGKLQGTCEELKDFSEKLTNEISGFESLKGNLEKFAAETGADVRKVLGDAQNLEKKMKTMTMQNERALLGKIAQDIEFMDQDAGMSKKEFESFFNRIPIHLQEKFHVKGLTFEKVAGDDGVIDFMEIETMINTLLEENAHDIAELN